MFFRQFENSSCLWLLTLSIKESYSFAVFVHFFPSPDTHSSKSLFHAFSFLLKPPASPHPSLIPTGDLASHFTDKIRTLWRQYILLVLKTHTHHICTYRLWFPPCWNIHTLLCTAIQDLPFFLRWTLSLPTYSRILLWNWSLLPASLIFPLSRIIPINTQKYLPS